MNLPDKAFFRPDEIADYFGVAKRTVYVWIDTGRLRSIKVAGTTVRISREALLEIVQGVGE